MSRLINRKIDVTTQSSLPHVIRNGENYIPWFAHSTSGLNRVPGGWGKVSGSSIVWRPQKRTSLTSNALMALGQSTEFGIEVLLAEYGLMLRYVGEFKTALHTRADLRSRCCCYQ